MGFVSGFASFGRYFHKSALTSLVALGIAVVPVVALTGLSLPAQAQTQQQADDVARFDPEIIERIETYLNNITTLKADFVQISSDGGAADGQLFMERPGKMRFEYNPPAQILLVSTGHDLIYFDKEINAPTYFSIDETPAGVILADQVSLSRDVRVIDLRRAAGTTRVTLVRRKDPGAGTVTLVFQDNPMQLRQWIVADAAGVETTVTLFDTVQGISLDPELFKFKRIWQ
ncbi:outer membrane lipoprotein carrier protein LolA [Thalassospira sp.]|uniref:LolA family protein n=1 Tax=Thalassospira sp. TaxID=1912094 RepID=UPI002732D27C|nr:outer membrane lipoprotein carrier protein LolA [Thalassospira sp.]MDP2699271.1 outer membrane lipoprotein carrier protein LolA [Thalassospira sp.]